MTRKIVIATLLVLGIFGVNRTLAGPKHRYMDFPVSSMAEPGQIPIITRQSVNDYQCLPAPGNPPTGYVRVYCDSSTGLLTAINSTGGSANAGGATFGSGTSVIDGTQAPYNLKSGFHAFDCTFTSGSNQISCTNTTITSSMIGWLFQGTAHAGGGASLTGNSFSFPLNAGVENTITGCVPSCPSTTFTVTQNASATVLPGQSWVTAGPDMTSNLSALFQAAWNNPTVYSNCPSVYIAGILMTKTGQFNFTPGCSGPYEGPRGVEYSAALYGPSTFSAQIVGTQDFDYSTGAGQSCASFRCFGGSIGGLRIENVMFTASGGGPASASNVYLIGIQVDSALTNFSCVGWGGGSVGLFGVAVGGSNQPFTRIQLDGCGQLAMGIIGNLAPIMTNSFVGDETNDCVRIVPGSGTIFFMSSQNGYGGCGSGKDTIGIYNGGSFYSSNDTIASSSGCGVHAGVNAGTATARLSNDLILMSGTGNGICGTNSGVVYASDNNLTPSSGTAAQIVLSATSKFISGGANLISGITLNATTTTLVTAASDSIAGTLTAFTPTITVTGFGATPTVTLGAGINTVERGSVNVAAGGAGPAATGTLKLAFNQTYSLSGNPPACGFIFGNGTGTLTAPVTVIRDTTANVTTTQYQILWTAGGAVVAGNNYNIDWQCEVR